MVMAVCTYSAGLADCGWMPWSSRDPWGGRRAGWRPSSRRYVRQNKARKSCVESGV